VLIDDLVVYCELPGVPAIIINDVAVSVNNWRNKATARRISRAEQELMEGAFYGKDFDFLTIFVNNCSRVRY